VRDSSIEDHELDILREYISFVHGHKVSTKGKRVKHPEGEEDKDLVLRIGPLINERLVRKMENKLMATGFTITDFEDDRSIAMVHFIGLDSHKSWSVLEKVAAIFTRVSEPYSFSDHDFHGEGESAQMILHKPVPLDDNFEAVIEEMPVYDIRVLIEPTVESVKPKWHK